MRSPSIPTRSRAPPRGWRSRSAGSTCSRSRAASVRTGRMSGTQSPSALPSWATFASMSSRPARSSCSLSSSAAASGLPPMRSFVNDALVTVLAALSCLFRLDQAGVERVADELRPGREPELLHDVRAVRLSCADGDVEHRRDLLVRVAEGKQAQDLPLAL